MLFRSRMGKALRISLSKSCCIPKSHNHNHRPCRWFAQAPLGPITSRAYRLIESSFYCMMRPTAIEIAAWRILLFTSLDYLPFLIAPYQLLSRLVPRFARIFFLGIAKAFWNHRHCRWFSLYKKVQTGKSGLHLLLMADILRQLAANLDPPYQAARSKTPVR